MDLSLRRRLLKMAFKTICGKQSQGYFIPYRYADQVPQPGTNPTYTHVEELFNKKQGVFLEILSWMERYEEQFNGFYHASKPMPRWQQDWFPRLDGACAYTMVRHHKPCQIIEIGSGHSTRFLYQAVKDENLDTEFIAIDPAPRADISALPITLHNKIVQDFTIDAFSTLESGDVLFIDSSHILVPGSDVDYLINRIIPSLKSGVLIHIHDITLPDDYPLTWTWRGYNEQQGIVPLLTFGKFEVLWSSNYVASRMKFELDNHFVGGLPLPEGAIETSLWLRKS